MRRSIAVTLLGQNDLVREGLRRILSGGEFNIVESVQNVASMSEFKGAGTHILLLDHAGAHDVSALHARFPRSRIVVLCETFDYEELVAAFGAGADAVLVKQICCKSLMASLRLVAAGEKVLPSQLVDALPRPVPAEEPITTLDDAHLSEREQSILRCIIMGWQNKVISRHLGITEATVKVHVKAILRKLGVQNRTQAAMRAMSVPAATPRAEPAAKVKVAELKMVSPTSGRA